MSNGENSAFLLDPAAYIAAKPIDITRFALSVKGHLETRASSQSEQTIDTWWRGKGPAYMNEWNTIKFDLIKQSKRTVEGNKTSYIFRVDRRSFSEEQKQRMTEARWKEFDLATHAITGHFFPYLVPPGGMPDVTAGRWGVAQMGKVDFRRRDPEHPFVFTGAMNGCAIVITESPLGDAYFRAYHYPNAATYFQFQRPEAWTDRPLYFWTAPDYGGDSDMEADALNFLHYSGGEWRLCCQPHIWIRTEQVRSGTFEMNASVPVTANRVKRIHGTALPGAIRLTALRRTFA